jgi:fibro-slime domain-containing protein
MMFVRAPRRLVVGVSVAFGFGLATVGCGSSAPWDGISMFSDGGGGGGDDSAIVATTDSGVEARPDSGFTITVNVDAATDVTVLPPADACAGGACGDATTTLAVCGDGMIGPGELCDDGNMTSGDGCSSTCQIETGFTCMTPGQPCVLIMLCGNGVIDGQEACDDGNTVAGDGCSPACQVETGWQCPIAGSSCTTICGDGIVVGREQCDLGALNGAMVSVPGSGDGGANDAAAADAGANDAGGYGGYGDAGSAGDAATDGGSGTTLVGTGCSAACVVEPGFACSAPPAASACHMTTCGDGIVEGYEQCDDGNRIPYDGCSPTCMIEPKCNGTGGCTGVCGDGLVFPGEQCDDGNTISGDGCSATCTIESGFTCDNAVQPPSATLVIPILYRDMMYWNTSTFPNPAPPGGGHPDFNHYSSGNVTGLVQSTLGPDGEPVFKSSGSSETLTSAESFCWWYHDTGCEDPDAGAPDAATTGDGGVTRNPYASLVSTDALGNPTTLTLTRGTAGTYTYADAQFFPVDHLGWNAGANAQVDTDCEPGLPNGPHNFSFTSELHYVFTFDASVAMSSAPAVFSFTGDDSVWAFINDQLVVDLGGVHSPASGTYTLDTAHANALGLVDGGWYSIDVFQAEQHVCRSTYNLTLSNFVHIVSTCQSVCGDGVVAGHEQCDTGTNNVAPAGAYGKGVCTTNCTLAPYCGDGDVDAQAGEQCDDGTNLATYGGSVATACGVGCKYAPYCGDGIVNGPEPCDNGANNVPSATAYGAGVCTTACAAAPRCGDGILQTQFGEQCDGTPGCGPNCQPSGAM